MKDNKSGAFSLSLVDSPIDPSAIDSIDRSRQSQTSSALAVFEMYEKRLREDLIRTTTFTLIKMRAEKSQSCQSNYILRQRKINRTENFYEFRINLEAVVRLACRTNPSFVLLLLLVFRALSKCETDARQYADIVVRPINRAD